MAITPKRVINEHVQIRPLPARAVEGKTGIVRTDSNLQFRPLPARTIQGKGNDAGMGNSGSNVLYEPIDHLIQHIKQYDPRLYEALKRLGNQFSPITQSFVEDSVASLFFHRTIDINDSTVGTDIAQHQTVYASKKDTAQKAILCRGVLRKVITDDLTLVINNVYKGESKIVGTFTIPQDTEVDVVVDFVDFDNSVMQYNSVLTWDITNSDGQKDKAGIATFTLWWSDAS